MADANLQKTGATGDGVGANTDAGSSSDTGADANAVAGAASGAGTGTGKSAVPVAQAGGVASANAAAHAQIVSSNLAPKNWQQAFKTDPAKQQMINTPLKHDKGIDPKDQEFLKLLLEKIEKNELKLFQPSSLLNAKAYEKLDDLAKGKADYEAFLMLGTIREIYKLWQSGQHETYQIENLVHRIRISKERLEEIGGDIYII